MSKKKKKEKPQVAVRMNRALRELMVDECEVQRKKRWRILPDGISEEYIYTDERGDILAIEFIRYRPVEYIEYDHLDKGDIIKAFGEIDWRY